MNNIKHPFLLSKDWGLSKKLLGKVLCNVIFVSDAQNQWTPTEKREFLVTFKNALSWIKKEAAADHAIVRFNIKQNDFFSERIIRDALNEETSSLSSAFLASQKPEGTQSYLEHIKQIYQSDEVALFMIYKPEFRAHVQRSLLGREVCALHAKSKKMTIVHETLHLFGAEDYYYPDAVRTIAEYCFPQSVMLSSSSGSQIDSLTRYLVGWRKELDVAARCFLSYTEDISTAQLSSANRIQINDERLYNELSPFATFQDLEQCARRKQPWANFLLGYCYQHGILTPANTNMAEECYRISGAADIFIADYALLELLLAKKHLSHNEMITAKLLLENTSKKHPWAESLFAVCLYTGCMYEQDKKHALSLTISKYRLHGYLSKDVTFKRLPVTYRQYLIAEKYSSKLPQLHLAMKNLVQRYEKYDTSGDPCLYYMMGVFLQKGVLLRKNEQRALELYRKAADAGFSAACSAVARCYLYGMGTNIDLREGQRWKECALVARQQEDAYEANFAIRLLRSPLT